MIKYAFNLNANEDSNYAMPQPATADGQLVLTFPTPPADIVYTVEASTDLTTWSTTGVNVQVSGNQVTATYALPDTGEAFLRIEIGPAP